jgi:hypothetical protein
MNAWLVWYELARFQVYIYIFTFNDDRYSLQVHSSDPSTESSESREGRSLLETSHWSIDS